MKFGLDKKNYDFLLNNLLKTFQGTRARLWCFGSRARGDNNPTSDIDILIEGDETLRKKVGVVSEFFQNSNFPIKVDFVLSCDLADSYRENVMKDRIEIK